MHTALATVENDRKLSPCHPNSSMPPNIRAKRLRDDDDESRELQKKRPKRTSHNKSHASATTSRESVEELLRRIGVDDDDSSLSSLSPPSGDYTKTRAKVVPTASSEDDVDDDKDEDEDLEFEDVPPAIAPQFPQAPQVFPDICVTLLEDNRTSLISLDKKGPTKKERAARLACHRLHVQLLLWHNAIRNAWLCDQEVQAILLSHLSPRLWDEVERWRKDSALEKKENAKVTVTMKANSKGKGKAQDSQETKLISGSKKRKSSHKDWGESAEPQDTGQVNMAHGDPLFGLMRSLAMFWKQRFRITAPGLRKVGYMSLQRLDRITKAYPRDQSNTSLYGERIGSLEQFRKCAQECTGSRDVGAQLFTALLRALKIDARMVASLQPLGFGWTKAEEADPAPDIMFDGLLIPSWAQTGVQQSVSVKGSAGTDEKKSVTTPASLARKAKAKSTPARGPKPTKKVDLASSGEEQTVNSKLVAKRRSSRRKPTSVPKPVEVSDSDSDNFKDMDEDSEDAIIQVDLGPEPSKTTPGSKSHYDHELEYPHYWTEVLSPITKTYVPVDPLVKFVVATQRSQVESFEPRGIKADKARQVIAYVIGYSKDGSAKDVTVRYLKRQMMPGRTKGMRLPVEKIPVYNKQGKVKRYEQFDWFKFVMMSYVRSDTHPKFPITKVDRLEDSTDLLARQPEKVVPKEGAETLQCYKSSSEFVLQRHLKREEALVPSAKPVKKFSMGGKSGAKTQEDVYLRKDVVVVKSAETWHKQGRAPKPGEEPLKRVPFRAATIKRRQALDAAEKATGQKMLQGLFSNEQTEWIIPPPIKDGKIPKNEFGNIDLFVDHMLPKGAVHITHRRAPAVCRRLGLDFAEAVVDFDFGHRVAAPVIRGAVVAEEHHDVILEALAKDDAEQARKADEKRSKAALAMWLKMLRGLRIVERLSREYGKRGEEVFYRQPPSGAANLAGDIEHEELELSGPEKKKESKHQEADDMAGGFLPEGFDLSEEEPEPVLGQRRLSSTPKSLRTHLKNPRRSPYFVSTNDGSDNDSNSDSDSDTGLIVENGDGDIAGTEPPSFLKMLSDSDSALSDIPSSVDVMEKIDEQDEPLPIAVRAPPTRRQRGGARGVAGTRSGKRRSARKVVESKDDVTACEDSDFLTD